VIVRGKAGEAGEFVARENEPEHARRDIFPTTNMQGAPAKLMPDAGDFMCQGGLLAVRWDR
jgi:hypothetical protein